MCLALWATMPPCQLAEKHSRPEGQAFEGSVTVFQTLMPVDLVFFFSMPAPKANKQHLS